MTPNVHQPADVSRAGRLGTYKNSLTFRLPTHASCPERSSQGPISWLGCGVLGGGMWGLYEVRRSSVYVRTM